MRLPEPIEKSGYFWLPENPEFKLPGVLHISDTAKATLEVLGLFGDNIIQMLAMPERQRIIGVIESIGFVTLEHCICINQTYSTGTSISKSSFIVNLVFSGFNYGSEKEISFREIEFTVEGLDEWLSITGLHQQNDFKSQEITIRFSPPKAIQINLSEGVQMTFGFGYSCNYGYTKAKIEQKSFIKITMENARPFKELISLIFKINNFFCFAIDNVVTINSMTGYVDSFKSDEEEIEAHFTPVSIYYRSILCPDLKTVVSEFDVFFSYKDVATQLEKILVNWLSNYEISEPAFNLYFASKSGAHKYINGEFLSLAQGLETLHRRNSPEKISMPENVFCELKNNLLEVCPEDKKEWLEGSLKYANGISLRHRIKQMIEPFKELYGSRREQSSFIDKVLNTRNYLTHYSPSLKDKSCDGIELAKLSQKLEVLFQLHFLHLVGLDHSLIIKLAKENTALQEKLRISDQPIKEEHLSEDGKTIETYHF